MASSSSSEEENMSDDDESEVKDWQVFIDPDTSQHYYSSKSLEKLVLDIPAGIQPSAFDWSKEMRGILEVCDVATLQTICQEWSIDKFMVFARTWSVKKFLTIVHGWKPEKIAIIFRHKFLPPAALSIMLRKWPHADVMHILELCKDDEDFLFAVIDCAFYKQEFWTDEDVSHLLEALPHGTIASLLARVNAHEVGYFIQYWGDKFATEIITATKAAQSWKIEALASRSELLADNRWTKVFQSIEDSSEEHLRELFDSIDKDSSGELDCDEMLQCMKALGLPLRKRDVLEMIESCSGGTSITFGEFVQMVRTTQKKHLRRRAEKKWIHVFSGTSLTEMNGEVLRRVFDDIDIDGSGSLDISEVSALLKTAGEGDEGDPDDLIREMVEEADESGDGEISFSEFTKMVQTLSFKYTRKSQRAQSC